MLANVFQFASTNDTRKDAVYFRFIMKPERNTVKWRNIKYVDLIPIPFFGHPSVLPARNDLANAMKIWPMYFRKLFIVSPCMPNLFFALS